MERRLRTIWTFVQSVEPGKKEHGDTWFNPSTGEGWVWDNRLKHWSVFHLSATAGYGSAAYSLMLGTYPWRSIGKLLFETEAVSTLTAQLNVSREVCAGVSSYNAAYACGGATSPGVYTTTIDKLFFSSEVVGILSTGLSLGRYETAGVSGLIAGYALGGWFASSTSNRIDRLYYESEAVSSISSTLSVSVLNGDSACQSYQAGYLFGGASGSFTPPYTTQVQRLDFATENSSVVVSALTVARMEAIALDSVVAGYCFGGKVDNGISPALTDYWKMRFTTEVLQKIGDLAVGVARLGGCSSYEYGYVGGGHKIEFTTDTVSITSLGGFGGPPCVENKN